jgi:hypothetical protein
MIKKIVSGGQTGADQAALDTAIKLDIPHGGWLPKGRLTEAGPLPGKYQLKEMASSSYSKRTEQNVIDSDGTLIFSHGELTGGSKLTQEFAEKHFRPFLHVDLNKTISFDAARDINSWVRKNSIETLNVAGPRASSDPNIYQAVTDILEASFYLNLMEAGKSEKADYIRRQEEKDTGPNFPQTIDEAVEKLIHIMNLKDKVTIANMTETEMESLYPRFGRYIIAKFGLLKDNDSLFRSCSHNSNIKNPDDRDAAEIIIKKLWKKLRETHRLKIVK